MKTRTQEKRTIDASDIMLDTDMERILLGTYDKPRCVSELSDLYGIPVATCFNKVKQLKKKGLLSVAETVRIPGRRKVEYYTANLENAYVFYDSGKVKVRFTVVMQMAQDFRNRFERNAGSLRKEHEERFRDNQE